MKRECSLRHLWISCHANGNSLFIYLPREDKHSLHVRAVKSTHRLFGLTCIDQFVLSYVRTYIDKNEPRYHDYEWSSFIQFMCSSSSCMRVTTAKVGRDVCAMAYIELSELKCMYAARWVTKFVTWEWKE